MRAEPGAINVIPGRAEFPGRAARPRRREDRPHVGEGPGAFRATDQAEETETTLHASRRRAGRPSGSDPAGGDPGRRRSAGLATVDLPSLAGQDSQKIALIAPMAMIFVPSKDGISHSPKEFTSPQDVANGAEVLYRTILLLDERLDRGR